ncbi:hypothetical protein [Nocardiopsis halophila]|uniref:hypothetical protein n=1 Tax=Nocardiopsis halophila TaxID=141692 RepID=UPI000345078D|nr:hypothetical protein [Nocardiopsis halophila]
MLRKITLARTAATIAGLAVACTLASSPAAAAGTPAPANEGSSSTAAAPKYWASAPTRIATGNIRFPVAWSFAPKVRKVCLSANYSGNGVVPGGPLHSKCWNVDDASGARFIDVSCSFYGGVWSYANYYDGSGKKLAYRESPESIYIC